LSPSFKSEEDFFLSSLAKYKQATTIKTSKLNKLNEMNNPNLVITPSFSPTKSVDPNDVSPMSEVADSERDSLNSLFRRHSLDSVDRNELLEGVQLKKKKKGIALTRKKQPSPPQYVCNHPEHTHVTSSSTTPHHTCNHTIPTAANVTTQEEPKEKNLSYTIEGMIEKSKQGSQYLKVEEACRQVQQQQTNEEQEELTEAEIESVNLYDLLLNNNKEWVSEKTSKDPQFFSRLKDIQKPDYLLIGCSDSRVPPDQLTKTQPGQIFIHRNVANLVVNTDLNVMSVLQYAVEVLKVKHVIVMGHTRCGGVIASLTNQKFGLIDNWLRNIKDVYRLHKDEVDSITEYDKKLNRMIELNVIEQTLNICKTSIIQDAWAKGVPVHVHGWICDIETGLIKDLEIEETVWKKIESIYKFDLD